MKCTKPAIDPTALDQLRLLQNPQRPNVVNNLIKLFMDTTEQSMIEIRSAVRKGDFTALHRTAHGLKSAAANLGALRMSVLCLKLEKFDPQMPHECELPQLCQELEDEFFKAKAELSQIKVA